VKRKDLSKGGSYIEGSKTSGDRLISTKLLRGLDCGTALDHRQIKVFTGKRFPAKFHRTRLFSKSGERGLDVGKDALSTNELSNSFLWGRSNKVTKNNGFECTKIFWTNQWREKWQSWEKKA